MKSPCKDCVKRAAGCHGTCPQYGAYADERRRIYAERERNSVGEGEPILAYLKRKREMRRK